ncbi:uncharacterized protein LOC142017876 [Carettochelys insculpta]|uniref:uncharacterized protein LOC142017876 n=1 Tax=Carettochelys insculpta TaxID=44489 RepID=UPI003EC0DC46
MCKRSSCGVRAGRAARRGGDNAGPKTSGCGGGIRAPRSPPPPPRVGSGWIARPAGEQGEAGRRSAAWGRPGSWMAARLCAAAGAGERPRSAHLDRRAPGARRSSRRAPGAEAGPSSGGSPGMQSLLCTLVGERWIGEQMEWRAVKATRVRRNLFGPVDHEQLQQDFQHMLRSSIEGAQKKWNFDFLQDMPAEGLLQWEELQSRDVPAFYHSCVVGEARKPLKPLNQGIVKEVKGHNFATVTLTENPKVTKKMLGKKNQAGKKRRQTSLTDYYSAKKQVKTTSQAATKNLTF